MKNTEKIDANYEIAYFAGGCFWCIEGIMDNQNGVIEAVSGYSGGDEVNPTYENVSSGNTNYRETVKVIFDPNIITYRELIDIFWRQIDPTDEGGQFADRGFQYTTAIFYTDERQKIEAENSKKLLENSLKFNEKIATKIIEFTNFYKAEDYHQDYYKKNSFRYKMYKKASGRDSYIKKTRGLENNNGSLRNRLTDIQYKVTQEDGTEKPFDNEYWDNHEDGIYVDIVDGTPLFSSLDKFDSGSGWPSFTKVIDNDFILEVEDNSLFMKRTEVRSKKADSHLGHVFNDGPYEEGGLRYCINSAAIKFIPIDEMKEKGYEEYLKLFAA